MTYGSVRTVFHYAAALGFCGVLALAPFQRSGVASIALDICEIVTALCVVGAFLAHAMMQRVAHKEMAQKTKERGREISELAAALSGQRDKCMQELRHVACDHRDHNPNTGG